MLKVGGTPDFFEKIEGTPEKNSVIQSIRHNMLKMLVGQKRGISPNPLGDFIKSPALLKSRELPFTNPLKMSVFWPSKKYVLKFSGTELQLAVILTQTTWNTWNILKRTSRPFQQFLV